MNFGPSSMPTLRSTRNLLLAAAVGVTHLWIEPNPAQADDLRWTNLGGSAIPKSWTDPENWLDEIAPDLVESNLVRFNNSLAGGTFTVEIDTPGNQILEGGLWLQMSTGNPGNMTLDLQDQTLVLNGSELVYNPASVVSDTRVTATFDNGRVQFGDTLATNIRFGDGGYNNGTLTTSLGVAFTEDAIFDAHNLGNFQIASGTTNIRTWSFFLDLSETTIQSGSEENALVIGENLEIAFHNETGASETERRKYGELRLGELESLRVAGNLILGRSRSTNENLLGVQGILDFAATNQGAAELVIGGNLQVGVGPQASGIIQNAPELAITLGSASTPVEERGDVWIGYLNIVGAGNITSGSIVAPDSSLHGWINELRIGEVSAGAGEVEGIFDLGNASEVELVISGEAVIGRGADARGEFRVANASIQSMSLVVGQTTDADRSLLRLHHSLWEVGEVLVGAAGDVEIVLGAASGGLDILGSDAADFSLLPNGLVQVDFAQAPTTEPIWGVRMLGDHTALFQSYVDSGTLSATGAFGGAAEVFFLDGFTHFGVIPEPSTLALFGLSLLIFSRRGTRRSS